MFKKHNHRVNNLQVQVKQVYSFLYIYLLNKITFLSAYEVQ